jgi:hypothetical protein
VDAPREDLPPPAHYFAPRRGVYETVPGLSRLGTAFGNGAADARLFQIDCEWPAYRAAKLAARAERLGKYVVYDPRFSEGGPLAEAVTRLLTVRLAVEHPKRFALEPGASGAGVLSCGLSGERLRFDGRMRLVGVEGGAPLILPYRDAFDALCCQVQEDLCVVVLPPDCPDFNAALHVCLPSRWAPEEKVGASFAATHAQVPHLERVSRAAGPLLGAVLDGAPVTRFNWSVEFTDRLSLHPDIPSGADAADWSRDGFDPARRPPYLRVERQTLWGVPEARAVVFGIRVYVYPADSLTADERRLLAAGLRSMSPQTRAYKGFSDATCAAVADWLET